MFNTINALINGATNTQQSEIKSEATTFDKTIFNIMDLMPQETGPSMHLIIQNRINMVSSATSECRMAISSYDGSKKEASQLISFLKETNALMQGILVELRKETGWGVYAFNN